MDDNIKNGERQEGTGEDAFSLLLRGKEGDPFPVLRAFREYVEAERERARRRQTRTVIGFLSVITVMVFLFFAISAFFINKFWDRGNDQMRMMLSILTEKREAPSQTAEAPANILPTEIYNSKTLFDVLELLKRVEAQAARLEAAAAEKTTVQTEPPAEKIAPPPAENIAPPAPRPAKPLKGVIVNGQPVDFSKRYLNRGSRASGKTAQNQTAVIAETHSAYAETTAPEEKVCVPTEDASGLQKEIVPDTPVVSETRKPAEPPPVELTTSSRKDAVPENTPAAADSSPEDWKPVKINLGRIRRNAVPDGHFQEKATIVTEEGRISVPWRILIPSSETPVNQESGI